MASAGRSTLLLALLFATPLRAATSEEAWALYLEGDYAAAATAASELFAEEASRADALSLLGSIAAAQGSYEAAREHWLAAADLGGPAGREAASKAVLLCALTECGEPAAEGGQVATPPEPETSGPGSTVVPLPAPATPVTRAQTPSAPEAGPADTSNLVLVAGRGTPPDEVRNAAARMTGFLREHGVDAESPTEAIAVVQDSEIVLAQLLTAARERGAVGVLLVDARFGFREQVEATCYGPGGGVLLSESVTGGTGLVRPVRMNANLMERLEEKLSARIGGPCLPVAP